MNTNITGLLGGIVFGFTLAWAQLTDPHVIRTMLLLKEPPVFLIMGPAVLAAAMGTQRGIRRLAIRRAAKTDRDGPHPRVQSRRLMSALTC